MIGTLSKTLTVGGVEYDIDTDYRNVLRIFEAFEDPELSQEEKWIVAIFRMFSSFCDDDDVLQAAQDGFDISEAQKQILWFIAAGHPEKQIIELPVYSWSQDEQIIFSAVNKVAGRETRELKYLHWWTFLGYFNEVGEGTFSFIVGIRNKLNKGKKLEKHEKEFLSHNKDLVRLEKRKSKEELEVEAHYKEVWGNLV